MRNTLTQDSILYDILKNSALLSEVSGSLYRTNRPDGSELEDVVINSINLSTGDIQRGTSNVNIYVKDIISEGLKQPDSARLEQLTIIATDILKKKHGGFYKFWISLFTVFEERNTDFSYQNIRIEFLFFEPI